MAARKKRMIRYPVPGKHGGTLIRKVIAEFRGAGMKLPIDSHILIAVSGGADSLALGHLLLKYGRRVVDPARVGLLHINHGWRGSASDQDAQFVKRLGKEWGVRVITHKLKPPSDSHMKGKSWEDVARQSRKAVYEKEAVKWGAKILTGHQADDLAETVLWRLLTGAAETHGGGIAFAHGVELRPLLRVRKDELKAYLEEERQVWREDSTNAAGRFLRSKMRLTVMPAIEELFPRAVEHLVKLAGKASKAQAPRTEEELGALGELLSSAGIRPRRAHWDALKADKAISLPGGWRLSKQCDGRSVRWVLEAAVSS